MIAQMTEIIAELKILREYRIPVGDPAGTVSVVGQKNQYTVRMYTTLTTHDRKYDVVHTSRTGGTQTL